jgi:hypothetical protein
MKTQQQKTVTVDLPLTHQAEAAKAGGRWDVNRWGWVFPDNTRTMEFVSRVERETGTVIGVRTNP